MSVIYNNSEKSTDYLLLKETVSIGNGQSLIVIHADNDKLTLSQNNRLQCEVWVFF